MVELVTEILVYLAVAALIGLLLGYLIWGWGRRERIAAARAEGAASARTSVDGDAAAHARLEASDAERSRLQAEVERLTAQLKQAGSSQRKLELVDTPAAVAAAAPEAVLAPIGQGSEVDAETAFLPSEDAIITPIEERAARPGIDAPAPPAPKAALETTVGSDMAAAPLAPEPGAAEDPPAVAAAPPPPPSLLDERPAEVDDLKRIKGVGPVLENVLNSKGVYLFHQVANFTSADVAWVNEAIDAFPGRIERDGWVAQAQNLYRKKYGRAHDATD